MRFWGFAAAVAAIAVISPALAGDRDTVIDYLKAQMADHAEGTKLYIGFADLSGDGQDEAIVYVAGAYWCGSGGCNALVLTPDGDSWKEVGNTTVSSLPIGMLDSESNGWKDLAVSFGDAIESGIGQMQFEGDAYPRNPTTAPRADEIGTVIIAEDAEPTAL